MIKKGRVLIGMLGLVMSAPIFAERPLKALIVDGQNNHQWRETTPVLKKILEETGLFMVEVATSPPEGEDLSAFKPDFTKYEVVVSNYNGKSWSDEALQALVEYVGSGGGFVSFHAADNAFPEFQEYNEMIGLGGWGERDERWGPYVHFENGQLVFNQSPGKGGGHGRRHRFEIVMRNMGHPITSGLPRKWVHDEDELYHRLRGPAKNMTLLATAYSDPQTGGTGDNEPMLFIVDYGHGRVFHTTLGHSTQAMKSQGFIVTLQRGAEWAAYGKVTQKVPTNFK